jgi:hypothetical protein
MRKNLILTTLGALLFSVLLTSCHKNRFSIEGSLENGAGKTIYITELTPRDGEKNITTLTLDEKGQFSFKHDMEYQTFYNLHVNQTDYIVLLPQKREKIKLKGNYNNLTHSYDVKGSPESLLLWQLQDYSNQGSEALVALVSQDHQNKTSLSEKEYLEAKKKTDSVFVSIHDQQAKYMMDFINENQGSLATLIALYKPFNNHPLLPPQTCVDLYEVVLQGLQKKAPNNPHTLNFKNTVEELKYKYGGDASGVTLDMNNQ